MRLKALSALIVACGWLGACEGVLKIPNRALGTELSCDNSVCTCMPGFGDCDGDPSNGCEADLTAAPNCGACGDSCDHGTCNAGVCACDKGYADCDHERADGCEVELATAGHDCGTCGHDCEGGSCAQAQCQAFVLAPVTYSYTLELKGSTLYVGNCPGTASIVGIPVTGGKPTAVSDPTITDCGLSQTIVGDTLYWGGKATNLYQTSLSTPSITTSFVSEPGAGFLGATTDSLYWVLPDAATKAGQVMRTPLAGGMSTAVSTNTVTALSAGGQSAYWSDATAIWSITDGETTPTKLASVVATALAVDDKNIYFQVAMAGISSIPLAGGTPHPVAPDASTFAMLSTGETLYYFDFDAGTLSSVPISGGKIRVLATSVQAPSTQAIAVTDDAVFFLSNGDVYKLVL